MQPAVLPQPSRSAFQTRAILHAWGTWVDRKYHVHCLDGIHLRHFLFPELQASGREDYELCRGKSTHPLGLAEN
jgi:hypothetical protein